MQQTIPEDANLTNKKRHGCFTTWLILLIIVNALLGISVFTEFDSASFFSLANMVRLIGIFGILAAIVGLFYWKKWGFWLFCALQLVYFIANLANGVGMLQALAGLISIPILYGVLQVGKDNKAWPQLG
jgi:hypothetical protein